MHSLFCCGILRVPSRKKKLYKTFVEIFSHMPILYKDSLDMVGFALHFRKIKKRIFLCNIKGNSSECNFNNRKKECGDLLVLDPIITEAVSLLNYYPSKINQDISILA